MRTLSKVAEFIGNMVIIAGILFAAFAAGAAVAAVLEWI